MSAEVERSRERFERSLDELRTALDQELGWLPKVNRWLLPLVAGAAGLAIGLVVRRNLPRLFARR